MRTLALLCAILAAAPSPAIAQSSDLPRALNLAAPKTKLWEAGSSSRPQLTYSWQVDGGIVALTGGVWILTELMKDQFAPAGCQWCARNGFDDSVKDALAWGNTGAASTISNVAGYAVLPLASLGALAFAANKDQRLDDMWGNTLLVVEAVAISSALNQLVKFSVGRERPFVADLPPGLKDKTDQPADNNLSFYSGHSNLAFALAVSAGTVAHMRGYEYEKVVWAVGLPLAGFVAYSRIAAKKHYLTDVLVGSVAGAAFGFGLPWFFHRPKADSSVTVSPLPNGAALTLRFD